MTTSLERMIVVGLLVDLDETSHRVHCVLHLGEVPEELVGLDPSEPGLVHHLCVVQALHLHVGCTSMRGASHRLDELLDDELYQVDPVFADLEALFPDLGEGLEDGWQVEVLGRVQVPSNVVYHREDAVVEEGRVVLEVLQESSILPHQLRVGKLAHMMGHVKFDPLHGVFSVGDALQGEEEHVVADDQVAEVLHALDLRVEAPQEKNQELANVRGMDGLLLQVAEVLLVRHGQALRLAVVDNRLDELPQGGHHQVHPSQMARDAGASFSVGNFKGFKKLDSLVGDIGEDPEADYGSNLVQADLKLGGKLEEVGEQPEEVGLVHRDVTVLPRELLEQLFHELAVAVVQEVHCELLQKLRDVLVGGDVVDHGLHPHPVFPALLQQLLTMLLLLVVGAKLWSDLSPRLNRIRPERLLVFVFVAGGRYVLLVQDLLRDVSKVTVHQALRSFWTFGFLRDPRDVAVVAA